MQLIQGNHLQKCYSIGLIILCLLFMSHVFAQTNEPVTTSVKNIRIWNAPDHTRLVFDLSAVANYKTLALSEPKRFIIDLSQGDNTAQIPNLSDNPRVVSLRHGGLNEQTYRYVLEVREAYNVNVFQLEPNELYGHRLVVDLYDIKGENKVKPLPGLVDTGVSIALPEPVANKSNVTILSNTVDEGSNIFSPPSKSKKRQFIVSIDAGHGGEDPGAIGYRRLREKNIVLAIAKLLQKRINEDPNMSAFLTRKGDYFVRLRNRTTIARTQKADMFISIHADAFAKKTASGFSVFALSQRGASSEMARTLARKENAADLIGGVSLKDKDDLLAKVLLDLSMTKNISEGVEFGTLVLKELKKLGKLHSRRVEQAGFAVLKSPDIPSILVETGFITNPTEAKKLNTKSFQIKIASAIYTAINLYRRKNPVFDQQTNLVVDNSLSNISSQKILPTSSTKKVHRVKRGEFLATIAKKYGVSIANLKRWNKLKSSKIFVDQKLRIYDDQSDSFAKSDESINDDSTKDDSNNKATQDSHIVRYKVRNGDNLSTLAERYGVTMANIKRQNSMNSNRLLIGKVLEIPIKSTKIAETKTTKSVDTQKIIHTVKRGQTLSGIAAKYSVKMSTIKRDNDLKKSTLGIGQKLVIHVVQQAIIHKVRNGENLSLIAKRYGVSVKAIKQKNKLESNTLFVGQKLKI